MGSLWVGHKRSGVVRYFLHNILMITETQQFKLTRLYELVGSSLASFDIVEMNVAQLLPAAHHLHLLAWSRVWAQNVASTSNRKALTTSHILYTIKTFWTSEMVIALRTEARGATWVSSHHRLIIAPHTVRHCTVGAFLVQL